MFCIKCGGQISENDKFCQNCGEKIDGIEQQQRSHQTGFGTNNKSRKFRKDIWKPALIIIVVVGLLVWAGIASENESNSNSDLVNVGDYWCSYSHADQADKLAPNVDYTDEITRLELLEKEINSMYVDEYSEVSVSSYNSKIDQYNTGWDSLENKIITTDGSLDQYNAKVDKYNSYLENNCDRK